jgi:hypothetical protein
MPSQLFPANMQHRRSTNYVPTIKGIDRRPTLSLIRKVGHEKPVLVIDAFDGNFRAHDLSFGGFISEKEYRFRTAPTRQSLCLTRTMLFLSFCWKSLPLFVSASFLVASA